MRWPFLVYVPAAPKQMEGHHLGVKGQGLPSPQDSWGPWLRAAGMGTERAPGKSLRVSSLVGLPGLDHSGQEEVPAAGAGLGVGRLPAAVPSLKSGGRSPGRLGCIWPPGQRARLGNQAELKLP